MYATRLTWIVLGVCLLSGCPDASPTSGGPTATTLRLDVDPGDRKSRGPVVGETVQLRLSYATSNAPQLLNTLVVNGESAPTWTIEPSEAVTIDPATSKARLNTSGEVTIRATFTIDGQSMISNPLRLRIRDLEAAVNTESAKTSK